MDVLFSALTHAIDSTPLLALGASFVWGVLSILLSPCHLAGIPLIVAFIAGQPDITTRRAFSLSALFAIGVLVTIALIGLLTAMVGHLVGNLGRVAGYVVAGVFFLVGLHLLEVIPLPFSAPGQLTMRGRGLVAAFLFGLFFGLALGPCSLAFMAPVLGVTFRVGMSAPWYAAGLLLAYGIGHCAVIAAAGTSAEAVQRLLHWNESNAALNIVRKVCGILVLLGGLYLVYKA